MQCFFLTAVFTAGIVINIASYIPLQTPRCTYIEDSEIDPIGLVQVFFLLKYNVAPSIRMNFEKLIANVQKGTFIKIILAFKLAYLNKIP
jgi:hypothetical protein